MIKVITLIAQMDKEETQAIAQLEELQQSYPGAKINLNGELTVNFPENVKIPVEPN
ncbi:MAG: hypothetical protein KME09_19745 [Pleurocapsa minor HA4230-MV1]|nr:hypothetical protein [Pleurocapsa minor HA4230-MV1]